MAILMFRFFNRTNYVKIHKSYSRCRCMCMYIFGSCQCESWITSIKFILAFIILTTLLDFNKRNYSFFFFSNYITHYFGGYVWIIEVPVLFLSQSTNHMNQNAACIEWLYPISPLNCNWRKNEKKLFITH